MRINPMSISLEMIDYQKNDPILGTLEKIIIDFRQVLEKGKPSEEDKKAFIDSLDKAFKDRFNINAKWEVLDDKTPNAYCIPEHFTLKHVLHDDLIANNPIFKTMMKNYNKDKLKKIAQGDLSSTGWVDNKKVKLGGLFSEVEVKFGITLGLITISEPMVAIATILHEMGHAWTFFEYIGVTLFRNAVIANTVKEYLGTNKAEERYQIIVKYKEIYGIELDNQITQVPDRNATQIIVGAYLKTFTHDNGYVAYDNTTVEQLADQFATRFGTGKYLAIFFNEFYKITGQDKKRLYLLNIIALFLSGIILACGVFMFFFGMANAMLMFYNGFLFMFLSVASVYGDGNFIGSVKLGETTYDETKVRMERVYRETIAALKNPNIDKLLLTQILDDIRTMKELLEKTKELGGWPLKFYAWLNSDYRNERAKQIYQLMIEEMMANELYVSSAKIKTLY